jgi:NADP-dependent 3-hydroxy acid dehydrogenase YdfG
MSIFAANKSALITGGASGVGLAVAQLCRKHGMKVALVDNNTEYLAKAKETLGSNDVETYQIDVSKIEQWKELKEKVIGKFGTVDLLMLNAGIGLKGSWGDTEYFQKVKNNYPS